MGAIKLGFDGFAEFELGKNFHILAKVDDDLAMGYALGLQDFLHRRWEFSCEEEVYLKVSVIRKCVPDLALSRGEINFTLKNNGEKGCFSWDSATVMFNLIYLNYLLVCLSDDKHEAIEHTREQLSDRLKVIECNTPKFKKDLMAEAVKFSKGIVILHS